MKKFLLWVLAVIITLGAAWYQRRTGPTNPRRFDVTLNDSLYNLKLVRSLGLDERSEIRLAVKDTSIKAVAYYRRFKTNEDYIRADFKFRSYPIDSRIMNGVFGITEEKGLYADIPQQPPAGKLEYFIELKSREGSRTFFSESPIVIRYKGAVPGWVLAPHVIIMFIAMLFSTLAGLMSITKHPDFRKYTLYTLLLLAAGGMILGPVVQKYAFGEFWTGIPFGWDLTDNKTLIAFLFWILAWIMNRKKERPGYTAFAALVLLLVYSIPHSMFGSELDYESGEVVQGLILLLLPVDLKKILN